MVYPINHPAVHGDGACDELHLNDERYIGEINNELLELTGNISEHHIGEMNKELSELIEKSHLSFQMSSFPLNFVGTHAHWIEK
jgi:hypothetical protein